MKDYQPISCAQHSEYELLAMRGAWVQLDYQQGTEQRRCRAQVMDVRTQNRAEYLILSDGQQDYCIRLDQIIALKKT